MRTKNAARDGQVSKKAAPNARQEQAYSLRRSSSSPYIRKIFPGRRDRSLPRPPAGNYRQASSGLRDALALLILSLQNSVLSSSQQRRGWKLVEKWLPEIITTRCVEAAA